MWLCQEMGRVGGKGRDGSVFRMLFVVMKCERSGCHCIILSRIIMQPAMIGATVCLHGPNVLTFW